MGQFDMLVEETKKLAREAAKATNPQLKQQFRRQDEPQVPAPPPEMDSRAEYDALVARRAREAPVPPPAVPAMDKFRAVEQAQAPPRDWVPPDFTAMDPTVLAQEFKSEGSKFLQRNPDFGSDTGLEDYEISAMSAMFSARKVGASILKYQGETDPEAAKAQSDARDGLFQDYEAALKLGQIDQAQYQSLLQNLPLGNLDAAAQSTLADIKAEHPLDYKYWLAAPENTSELYQKYIEHLTIPPDMPASSVQKALGLVGRVTGAIEKYGKEIPFAEPILGKGLGSLLTLGNIQKAGIAGTEAMPVPDSMKRIMEAAVNTGTDPIFLLSMLALPPYGFAAKAAIGAEIVAGSAVGGEVAPALGAPKWVGELAGAVGLTVGAGAVMRLAAAYGSPTSILGEVAAPKPFATSITGFTDNLGKRRWAGVSASTEGMTPSRMLEANEELAARLRGMGYDAQVADGAWLKDGVPTFEKSVFISDMSASDAAALGAELRQESVMLPEGVLNVSTNELNPVRGAPSVGGNLPIADGYTELTVAGKRVRFGLPIDWDNPVPFSIPLEAPAAAAGPATTYYHGTAAGEQIRASGALQPGEGGVVYVTRSPQTAETIAKTTAKLGGGTPETVEVSAPSNMKIASEAEVDAVRRAGEKVGVNMRGDTPALANAVRGRGYDAYDAGMGRIAVVKPDLITVGEERSITFQPNTAAELQEGVAWPWWSRRVYTRVYQVTGKIPLLRRAIIPANPQALLTEPMAKEVAALNGWVDWAAACDKMNLARLYAAPKSGWMAHVMAGAGKEDGFVVELTEAGRASKAWWKEGGQALATWNDILTYGATYYKLSAIDAKFVALTQQTLREMGIDLSKYSVEIRELLYEDGQGWIPRGAQAGKNGIEALKREYSSGRMVGGKGSFMKSRIYETQAEFHANGGDINKNAYDVIATTLTGMRRMEFDAQITEVAQRYGAKITDIVDPALKEAIPIARAYRTWDARIANYIKLQMKDLTVKQSFRQLRPVAGQVPDTWYSETATKVEDIVARFKAEAKEALTARRVNPRVRVPGLSKTELNRIAKPYKAELKGLLDAAKLRQGNSMATYMRAKADYEADIMKIRSSLIAGPTERVKPEYFGRFPEDSFAIGTIGSSRWPKLTGELFPQDIITRLDKVMNDSGNTVSAAIQKLNDFPRTIQAGADMNYPFIQSLPYLFRDPVGWARAISKSYGTVFDDPALGMKYMLAQSEKYPEEFASYLKWVRQMGDQEYFQSARQGGFLYKVPGVGHWYGKLAQGFDTMLDVGRWEYWKGIYAKAKTDGDFESLGAVTRDLLGTTSTRGLGVSMTQRQIEGGILMFAPRYTRSAFGLLAWAFNPGVAGGEARRSIISLMTGGTMLYYATCKALGQSPNLNPMEPGFMSVRVGDNWLGMGGIFRSMLRSAVWSMDTAINDPSKFYDPRRVLDNPVFEFFRSRSSPITTKLIDVVSGRDFVGNPTRSDWQDVATLGRRMFLPFGVDTILQSKGAMLPRMGAVVGEFFLGRSTPVAVGQIRDEEVVKWARENDITVHDAGTGKEREPDNYRELTADQRILFDTEKPQYTKDVQENTKAMERAWTEMDAVAKATETQLATASSIYNDPNSPHYQDGTWYRSMRGSILQTARIQREAFFDANPTVERNPTTMEQKWVTDYNENVIKASMDETLGEVDWLLQEQLDRQWRRDNGAEASAVVDKDYAASSDRLDSQFRADRIVVQPFFDFEDSMWSQDFFSDPADPIKLPSLSNGQKALNFRTSGEYRSALRADIYRSLQEAGKIPDNLAGIRTAKGGDALGERFPGKLSDTQIRRASNVLVTFFMQPFYDKSDPIVTEYLKAHPKYMEPLLRWDYWTGSVATEEALP